MITIISTFTASPMQFPLDYLLGKFTDVGCQFIYNQIFQQLLQTDSKLYQNSGGLNVLLIRFSDWMGKESGVNLAKAFNKKIDEFLKALINAERLFQVPVLVIVTPDQPNNPFEEMIYSEALKKIQITLQNTQRCSLITMEDIQKYYAVDDIFNDFTEKLAHIPYKMGFYTALSVFLVRRYYVLNAKPFKVIVLDCDGTLWNGVIEEDGIAGIRVTAREKYIQDFLLQQYKQGMLLCLCSKNSENSVVTVFQQHSDMILNLDHIASHKINWLRKSDNIKSIAEELNLGLDSFIFLDDNPLECAEVKSECPNVLTIHVPKNLNQVRRLFQNIWAFDHLKINQEDSQRTIFYKQNTQRNQLLITTPSYEEFLKKLNLHVDIQLATKKEFSRIHQLTARTNQFNLNPRKIKESDILKKITSQDGCLVAYASDKFGDYGLIGLLLYETLESELLVNTFLLSCRALGKGIEHKMLNKLAEIAKEKLLTNIKILFLKTEKNEPAFKFLQEISSAAIPQGSGHVLLSTLEAENIKIKPSESRAYSSVTHQKIIKASKNLDKPDFLITIAKTCQTVPAILSQLWKKNKIIHQLIQSDSPENIFKIEILKIFQKYNLSISNLNLPLVEYGLNSLQSVLICSDLYQKYQIEINYIDLINYSAKKVIDSLLEKMMRRDHYFSTHNSENAEFSFFPLSFQQQRLWLDEQLESNTAKNNISISLEIDENIDVEILNRCFMTLIERHDSLRFSFFNENGEAYLKIKSMAELDFNVNLQILEDFKQVIEKISSINQSSFNLNQAPLLRVDLFKVKSKKDVIHICIHHIIHDGWSLNILFKELGALYDAYQHSQSNPLKKILFDYKDFILWQQANFSNEILNNQKKFWEQNFKELSHLDLPYDVRHHKKTLQYKRFSFKLSKSLCKQLAKLAKKNKSTLYEVLLSAFDIFLAQYTNQTEISLITAVSGRHDQKISNLIGFFVNLLALKLTIEKKDNFSNILEKNKQFFTEAFLNQDLPCKPIISQIKVAFIYQNYPVQPLVINGTTAQRILADNNSLLYDSRKTYRFGDLVLFAQEYEEEVYCLFEYNNDLFFDQSIRRMAQSFKILLKNLSFNHEHPVLSIPLIDNKSKNILLNQFNPNFVKYDQSDNIINFFKECVRVNPNKLAVKYQHYKLTYLDLDKLSNQLSHYLKKKQVTHETPVGIYLQKGINFVLAMLSIIKAGGCYVPIAPELPEKKVYHILQETGINVVISEEKLDFLNKLPRENILLIFMEQKEIFQEDVRDSDYSGITPNHLAYIMYTSGSTGEPKGVMIEHKGIMRLIKATNYINIENHDHVAQTANLTFDGATFEIWGALLNGATLFIVNTDLMSNIQEFGNLLEKEKISVLFLTTQLFHVYAYQQPSIFSHLKYLVVGGEAVLAEAINAVMKMPARPKYFINGYGPTENTTFSCAYVIRNGKSLENPVSIGKPITGTQIYILNEYFNLAPIGAPGRLFVGGLGVARGYLHQPQLNQVKFIRNPFRSDEIIYDTGDIAAWQSNGNIKFLGRSDNQIKLHGYRIELNEIELTLKDHPNVEQAVVLVQKEGYKSGLAAYVLIRDAISLSEINFPHYLKDKLPRYMIPSLYYAVDKFPMNHLGKIDRLALSKIKVDSHRYNIYEEPHNKIQRELVIIYSHILGLDRNVVSINSDFFALGGDSLSAIRLINDLHIKYLTKINLSLLYEYPTVKLLSSKIQSLLAEKNQKLYPCNLKMYEEFTLKVVKLGDITKAPIIFIHPIGGTGFCYLDLIRSLPTDQPCYIIQDPSIEADQIIFENISEMAVYYNQVILNKFKKGPPLILAGFSFGGMLCLEMVKNLEQAGKENKIEIIVSFDTWVMSDVLDIKVKETIKSNMLHQYDKIMKSLLKQNIDPKPWMELNYSRLQHLGFTYSPEPINKKIILFKAKELFIDFLEMQEPTNYLQFHTTQTVEVYQVPGNHETILQGQNAEKIARLLAPVLENVTAPEGVT